MLRPAGFHHSHINDQQACLRALVQLPPVPIEAHPSRMNPSVNFEGNIWASSDGTPQEDEPSCLAVSRRVEDYVPIIIIIGVAGVWAIFLCTETAVLEFNYDGEARESFRTPSFWKQKRRAARFATSFLCTGTAVLEFNYEGEARESFRTPSFWKQKRRAARFATSSSLF